MEVVPFFFQDPPPSLGSFPTSCSALCCCPSSARPSGDHKTSPFPKPASPEGLVTLPLTAVIAFMQAVTILGLSEQCFGSRTWLSCGCQLCSSELCEVADRLHYSLSVCSSSKIHLSAPYKLAVLVSHSSPGTSIRRCLCSSCVAFLDKNGSS